MSSSLVARTSNQGQGNSPGSSPNSVMIREIATPGSEGGQPLIPSPRTGSASAPIHHERAVPLVAVGAYRFSPRLVHGRSMSSSCGLGNNPPLSTSLPPDLPHLRSPLPFVSSSSGGGGSSYPFHRPRRVRSAPFGRAQSMGSSSKTNRPDTSPHISPRYHKKLAALSEAAADVQTKKALALNDSMVYLDGPQVYACQQCRTHLTSHDDIISKSFHGRHGRAYLLNQAVNVRVGPPEDRMLMTGMHAVCDIFCKRCSTLIGWTYQKAYEQSQKYKEGKFIIEKINLYLEESDYYTAPQPAGERRDHWRQRSLSWGNKGECSENGQPAAYDPYSSNGSMVYEYAPSTERSRSGSARSLGTHS